VLDDTVQVLSSHLTDTEVIVVEAAAQALRQLYLRGAIDSKVLDNTAFETASQLKSQDWLHRWAACVCLGALGPTALPYMQDLQARASDEDENAFVHDAAKQSLNRLAILQRSEHFQDRSLDRMHAAQSLVGYSFSPPEPPHGSVRA